MNAAEPQATIPASWGVSALLYIGIDLGQQSPFVEESNTQHSKQYTVACQLSRQLEEEVTITLSAVCNLQLCMHNFETSIKSSTRLVASEFDW